MFSLVFVGAPERCQYDRETVKKLIGVPGITMHDWDAVQSLEEMQSYVPLLTLETPGAPNSPCVGLFRDGVCIEVACGYEGRQLAEKFIGMN
jgi:hypothetical protein